MKVKFVILVWLLWSEGSEVTELNVDDIFMNLWIAASWLTNVLFICKNP